ncbi:hypothetical protein C3B44_01810 [Corynebacterium yudongzhengii]|uniref:Serine aminopeptidase S33 domain-containing protein n=1 Tax=Corynebacterium yudongzhengii TaxID=2080740 RepID=A0A2U1T9T3_9CORY|nr:hypothetical protein C3B44_01810 [Corynebacterium yudongzhengii]PWC02770.1 hypothetical protein DF222_00540 [Corynebacterium yudongzhengii]
MEAAVGVVEKLSAPAVIIGHSMGGAIATAVAKQVPKKMRGLILADPAWLSVEQERFYAEAAGESVRRTARWQCDPVGALAENTLKRAHWRSTDHLHWLYGQLHVDLGVVASGVVSFPAPWQDYVADLAVPTHVITSGDDCLVGEAGAEAIRGMGRPELTVTYLEGARIPCPSICRKPSAPKCGGYYASWAPRGGAR